MRRILTFTTTLTFIFLLAPLAAVVPIGLSGGETLALPTQGFSLRWWRVLIDDPRWMLAFLNSVKVGAGATLLSLLLGVPAAIGLWRAHFPGRGVVLALCALPLAVPTVTAALALYFGLSALGLANSLLGLTLAHTVLAVPFVTIAVMASLRMVDPSLLDTAASCGAGPWQRFRHVLAPLTARGIGAGALFAFATSFDELMVAIFVTAPGAYTLPRQMYAGIREQLSPALCAAATFITLLAILLMWVAERLRAPR